MVATAGFIFVGLAMYSLLYSQFIIPENRKERVTQTAVQIPASFGLITCGSLLKTPKSKARKTKIVAKNKAQTIITYLLITTNIEDCMFQRVIFNDLDFYWVA